MEDNMMRLTNLLYSLIVLLLLSHLGFSQYSHISFPIASSELFRDLPNHEPDYTMGVGDINGDGEQDIIVRVWNEGAPGSGKDEYFDFESWIYAYTLEGQQLWEFNTKATWNGFYDPSATAPMIVWDFDKDGREEVLTLEGNDLVILGYNKNNLVIENRTSLNEICGEILATMAFLKGRENDPFIVVAYGENWKNAQGDGVFDEKVVAFDMNLNEYKRFDEVEYYDQTPNFKMFRGFDFDNDGNDELEFGPLLLNEDLTLYLDGTSFVGGESKGLSTRSYIADIDPDNSGYEWYIMRTEGYETYGSPETWSPKKWHGPYLISISDSKLLWHHDGTQSGCYGWGDMHRGWIGNTHADMPGLEVFTTGQLWKNQQEWNTALENHSYSRVRKSSKSESWMHFDCKGNILIEKIDSYDYIVGYPINWNDDPDVEFFSYRNGKLYESFPDGKVIAQLQKHDGSGECTITDFLGDWREEIIVTDWHIVHIFSNNEPTKFPDRPFLREGHHYRIHQASIGGGLPKPYPPDVGWPFVLK